jgi:hypothetical protein
MAVQFQYHVLVKGFNIKEKKNEDYVDTDLRHYRFLVTEHSFKNENGAYTFYKGKEFVGSFPVNATMVLYEQVKEQREHY